MSERDLETSAHTLPSQSSFDSSGVTMPAEDAGPLPSLMPGDVLADRYQVVRFIDRGGMGEVFLGEHMTLRRRVALKVAAIRADGSGSRRRFLQEARAASKIHHANVVAITDFGHTEEGAPFFAMEYLEGENLGQTLAREGRLPWPRARAIMLQILAALAAAHASGIIHRDMKPGNCFRITHAGDPDFIKVMDFGLAKVMSEGLDVSDRTQSGVILGTARYMSPEQAMGRKVDLRTDLYSAGVMLFQMVTGTLPFHAETFIGMLQQHISTPPPSARKTAPEAEIGAGLEHLLFKALAKSPAQRFQSAEEFAAALRRLGDDAARGPGLGVRAPLVATAAAVVTACLTALPWWLQQAPATVEVASVEGDAAMEIEGAPAGAPGVGSLAGAVERPPASVEDVSAGAPAEVRAGDAAASAELEKSEERETVAGDRGARRASDASAGEATSRPRAPAKSKPRAQETAPLEVPTPPPVAEKSAPRAEVASPAQLVAQAVDRADPGIKECRARFGGFPGEKVRVTFSVLQDGSVADVAVQAPTGSSPLGHCIRGVLDALELSAGEQTHRLTHAFVL